MYVLIIKKKEERTDGNNGGVSVPELKPPFFPASVLHL